MILQSLKGLLTTKNMIAAAVIVAVVWMLYGKKEGFDCKNDPKTWLHSTLQPATFRDYEHKHYYNPIFNCGYGPGRFEWDNTYFGGSPPNHRYVPDWYPYRHYPYTKTFVDGEVLESWPFKPNWNNSKSKVGAKQYKPCNGN